MNIITARNLKKIYKVGENRIYALNGVNFSVEEGEFVAVVGSSGSGKSTLLNVIGALDDVTEGEIFIRGVSIGEMSQNEQTLFRRRNIGFVFQDFKLLPVLNVYDNIVLPLKLDGRMVDPEFTEMLLESLGLQKKVGQTPYTLSGGEQQRVAVARALITRPAVVLADEPTGNLDSKTGMEVIGLMKTLSRKFYQTLVVVTHNEEIAQMADRIVRIEDGQIYQEGKV
nr:ABC transporter ATP-binding protein [uncultured Sellimonas sp.]